MHQSPTHKMTLDSMLEVNINLSHSLYGPTFGVMLTETTMKAASTNFAPLDFFKTSFCSQKKCT